MMIEQHLQQQQQQQQRGRIINQQQQYQSHTQQQITGLGGHLRKLSPHPISGSSRHASSNSIDRSVKGSSESFHSCTSNLFGFNEDQSQNNYHSFNQADVFQSFPSNDPFESDASTTNWWNNSNNNNNQAVSSARLSSLNRTPQIESSISLSLNQNNNSNSSYRSNSSKPPKFPSKQSHKNVSQEQIINSRNLQNKQVNQNYSTSINSHNQQRSASSGSDEEEQKQPVFTNISSKIKPPLNNTNASNNQVTSKHQLQEKLLSHQVDTSVQSSKKKSIIGQSSTKGQNNDSIEFNVAQNAHQPNRGKPLSEYKRMLNNNNNTGLQQSQENDVPCKSPKSQSPINEPLRQVPHDNFVSYSGRVKLSKKKYPSYLNNDLPSPSEQSPRISIIQRRSKQHVSNIHESLPDQSNSISQQQLVIQPLMEVFKYFEEESSSNNNSYNKSGRSVLRNRLLERKKEDWKGKQAVTKKKRLWTMNLTFLISIILDKHPKLRYFLFLSHLIGVFARGFSYFFLSILCIKDRFFLNIFVPLISFARFYYAASMYYMLFYYEQKSDSFRSISMIFNKGFHQIESSNGDSGPKRQQQLLGGPLTQELISQKWDSGDTPEQRRAKILFAICPSEINYIALTRINDRKRGNLFVISNFIYQSIESILLYPGILYVSFNNSSERESQGDPLIFGFDFLILSRYIIFGALFVFFYFCVHLLIYGNRKFKF